MKTKSICILILALLLSLRGGPHSCICPPVIERALNTIATAVSAVTVKEASKDVCNDCGHSKNCCIATNDAEMTGVLSIAPSMFALALPIAEGRFPMQQWDIESDPACKWYLNKAPPWWQVRPSPITLHQKLTV